jgi:hypothetical protein
MRRYIIGALFIAILAAAAPLYAQRTPEIREELFYTYAGLCAESGYSMVWRNAWLGDHEGSVNSTGYYAAPGLLFDIYVRDFAGEFKALFMMNMVSDKDANIFHGFYNTNGKYLFHITPAFDLTAGLGVYLEGAPSSKAYNGAGGEITAGCVIDITGQWEWKIVADVICRYGFFGQDAKSTKFNTGVSVGVTRKVGRS